MLSIALSARGWRRIEMAVRRSSTSGARGRICSTRRRILEIIEVGVGISDYDIVGISKTRRMTARVSDVKSMEYLADGQCLSVSGKLSPF